VSAASPTPPEPFTTMYRRVMSATAPVIETWGRLSASGLEHVPESGPTLLIGNHDSYWDPVAIGVAARRRRQIRALAKSTLWKGPLVPILNGMGQIPIERGKGDAGALDRAIEELRGGACIGVFPEGTISRGQTLRARSGAGRLALAVPEARVVCVATRGTVDIVRAPTRPRISIEFFAPAGGQPQPGETAAELTLRVLAEIRERAPISIPGRARTAAKYRAAQAAAAEEEARGTPAEQAERAGAAAAERER
jgi:1-acyl-sn-glycerol-3-phosphate acyltransferase